MPSEARRASEECAASRVWGPGGLLPGAGAPSAVFQRRAPRALSNMRCSDELPLPLWRPRESCRSPGQSTRVRVSHFLPCQMLASTEQQARHARDPVAALVLLGMHEQHTSAAVRRVARGLFCHWSRHTHAARRPCWRVRLLQAQQQHVRPCQGCARVHKLKARAMRSCTDAHACCHMRAQATLGC